MRLPGMFLELNSAQLFCIDGYRFDLKAATEEGPIELPTAANRLTPNIAEYFRVDVDGDEVHLSGHLSGAYMAITRAFASKSYGAYLQSAIWDLVPAADKAERKKDEWTVDGARERTFRAALELPEELAERMKRLAVFTRDGFRALGQLEAAAKPATVRRLDPAQHPWF
ncbi:hypothetical protein M3Y99_01818800 [Aphelenchoides fujianensis]|nr:hypothetical protein M3Y99_01818800 [Aphelenchoides fujianensis]